MTVSIMIITHEQVGNALLSAATSVLGVLPLPTTVVAVGYDTDPDLLIPRLQKAAEDLEHGQGLLILTDLYGATPSNIALSFKNHSRIRIICGLNLPMLIRTMNYPTLDVDALAERALTGGRDGVRQCEVKLESEICEIA